MHFYTTQTTAPATGNVTETDHQVASAGIMEGCGEIEGVIHRGANSVVHDAGGHQVVTRQEFPVRVAGKFASVDFLHVDFEFAGVARGVLQPHREGCDVSTEADFVGSIDLLRVRIVVQGITRNISIDGGRRGVADGNIPACSSGAACAFNRHTAPALVLGEGEDGLVVEGGLSGGEGGGQGAVGLFDSHVAVGVGVAHEAHEVGGVARRGLDGHVGAVVDDEGVEGVVSGNHALGEDGGSAAVDIVNLVALIGAGRGFLSCDQRVGGGHTVYVFGNNGAVVGVRAEEDDIVAFDAGIPVPHLCLSDGGEVGREVFCHDKFRHTNFAPIGGKLEGRDGEAAGRVAGEAHLAAVVAGESQRGFGVEVGGGGVVGGDVGVDLGGGVVVVADIGAVEVHEVVGGVGRGLDGDAGVVVYIICIRLGGGSNEVAGVTDGGVADKVTFVDIGDIIIDDGFIVSADVCDCTVGIEPDVRDCST